MSGNKIPAALPLLFVLLYVVAFVYSRSISFSQFGDVTISITEDKFLCDKIECPPNAERCVVSKEKDPQDASILLRSNTCYSKTNEKVSETVNKEKVDPNSTVKLFVEANKNGMISTMTAEERAKFNQEMEKFKHDLEEEMRKMNEELAHMFD